VFKGTPKEGVALIFKELKFNENDFRLGKTKVFIRSPKTLVVFEEAREKIFPKMALMIQKHWKGYKARKNWQKLRAAIKVQLKWRSYMSKKYFIVLFKTFAVRFIKRNQKFCNLPVTNNNRTSKRHPTTDGGSRFPPTHHCSTALSACSRRSTSTGGRVKS